MTFPTPYEVTHFPCVGLEADDMGNEQPSWDTEGDSVRVYGWKPVAREKLVASQSPTISDQDHFTSRQITTVELAMPALAVSMLDRFEVGGQLYEVSGLRDNNTGFHCWNPGIVVELKRVGLDDQHQS